MGCAMMKALRESAANAPMVLNPREVALISLYPESDMSFMEVNMLPRKPHQTLQETPSQMFLPVATSTNPVGSFIARTLSKRITASQDIIDTEGLDVEEILKMGSIDFTENVEDEEDGRKESQIKKVPSFFDRVFSQDESFNMSVPLQLLLPMEASRSNQNIQNMMGNRPAGRPNSGKLSDFFMQGRSIFQSPMGKLAHPFDFPQYSPKRIRRSFSFESVH